VVAAGHELGNHTWTHLDLTRQSTSQTRHQLDQGRQPIQTAAAVRPRWFRSPRGELTGAAVCAAAELDEDLLLWSVEREPGGIATTAAVADHLARTLGHGDVVGLHDGIGRGTFDPRSPLARGLPARPGRAGRPARRPAAAPGQRDPPGHRLRAGGSGHAG
jgi:peptidoglycan/xylan/chitin deacetylase (PgdA/CDA1 family)